MKMETIASAQARHGCPCCGCKSVEEHEAGDVLIGTISSDCEELNGKTKRFVYGSDFWSAEDDEDGDCLILNYLFTGSSIICVPGSQGHSPFCCQYKLKFNAVDCCYSELYPAECECDPFRLKYTDINCEGGPQGSSYLCECDCDWPLTLDIEFAWEE